MQPLSPSDREDLRRFYLENGYFICRSVVDRPMLAELRSGIAEALGAAKSSGALFSGGGGISGHLNCFPGEGSRFAYRAVEEHGILDVVQRIVGGDPGRLFVGANVNLPKSVTQHYHVDSSFLEGYTIVNVAVVDTDLVNGAIDVVPGTHRRFYKYWRFALEGKQRLGVRLPLSAGDVLVRSSNLWHRGMPNLSEAPRPMLAFTLGDRRAPFPEGDAFAAHDGEVAFYPNWYRTNFLGRLRERTFVAAPITYSAYRFVRSLFGDKGYATP